MRTTHQNILRLSALVAALTCAVGSAQATQEQHPAMSFVPAVWRAASDAQLEALRGGFEIKPNLSVSFGFMRSVTINGDPVSEISFHLPDLANISADQARMVSDALTKANIIQNGTGNRVGTSLAGEAGGVTPIAVSMPGSTSAPQFSTAQVAPMVPAVVTVVQNTLDNQAIKSMTVIDAGVNSLGLLRSINVQTALKDALIGAIGVR